RVAARSAGSAQRGARLEAPAVDAPPEVLDELAKDPAIDGADPSRGIDHDPRHAAPLGVRNRAKCTIVSAHEPPRSQAMSAIDGAVSRRRVLAGVVGAGAVASLPAAGRRAGAQAKPTISYWNGLTGADGKVMDDLIERFTRETGIRIEQQRIPWADLYAKLQVSVPAGQGPDLALIHTVEVSHFASDGVLEAIDESAATGKGFRGDDYLPSTWQGGVYQGKRYAIPLDVPQHILYLNVKVMRDAGLMAADGKPKVPGSRDELIAMSKQ